MIHKATDLKFKEGTELELTFQDGEIKFYDIADLFDKYPQLEKLKNRDLFLSGKLAGGYGIIWNEDLDVDAETIYEDGVTVERTAISAFQAVGAAVHEARVLAGLTQGELSALCGIDQSDISKIERGVANASVKTLQRIAESLNKSIEIKFI